MGPKTTELLGVLQQLQVLLDRHGESFWGDWLETCRVEIKRGDLHGIDRLAGAFGGMGSVNDLVICTINGHSVRPEDTAKVNEELE